MKIFSWMQNKLNGKKGRPCSNTSSSNSQTKRAAPKEEFSDWPQALLAIGTFGNGALTSPGNPPPSDDFSDFTLEEVGELQSELKKLLSRKPQPVAAALSISKAPNGSDGQASDLPLEKFLNCPSSLEVDRRISDGDLSAAEEDRDEDIERTMSVILHRCKDLCAEDDQNQKKKKKMMIGKKSISFLVKKMFVCGNGFSPAPSLIGALPESRLEKLLRTMLHKKIHPRNSSRASSMKKYIEDGENPREETEDENKEEKIKDGHKWVKTDSEYIVLEI